MNTGIYKIFNKQNNNLYIGSAQKSFYKRKNQHFHLLRNNKHHSLHLQRAFNKYGENNFIFEIIEKCDPENCIKREQYYIDLLKPKYNIQPNAQSRKGIKLSIEVKNKALKALEKARLTCSTIESRKKMSNYHKGRKKSREHALAVGAASKKKVLQYDRNGMFIKQWDSIMEVENFYKAVQGTLWKALTGKTKTFRRFIWKYYTNDFPIKIDTSLHNWNYKK